MAVSAAILYTPIPNKMHVTKSYPTVKVNLTLSTWVSPDSSVSLTQSVDRIAFEECSQQALSFRTEELWHTQLGSVTNNTACDHDLLDSQCRVNEKHHP